MFQTFLSDTRLYEFSWHGDAGPSVMVEAWWGTESLSAGFEFNIDLLATDAYLELKHLLGRAATLRTRLSDGSDALRSGLIREAQKLGADGGFARYRVVLVPWVWLLDRGRHHRVFQNKTVVQIVESVFADYADNAAWQWTDEVEGFLADARPRSYCVQYDESDYAFISRLLAEEGLGWCVEEDSGAPAGHRLRLFADSQLFPEDILSQSANGGLGIRYHRASSQEDQDAVIAFGEQRRLESSLLCALSYDYKTKRAVRLDVPGLEAVGGEHAPRLEVFEDAGLYAWANAAEAERYGKLAMEAREARQRTWLGRSTVRSLRPGWRFDLVGLPVSVGQRSEHRYAASRVTHVGINNLSGATMAAIAERLAQQPPAPDTAPPAERPVRAEPPPAAVLKLATERGYANAFEAHHAQRAWRPQLTDATGTRLNPRPTATGSMSALVVGPDGSTTPNGADELWCDALGRVKIRFHWQQAEAADDRDSCWVRVMQRQAGGGMGWQWLPRIGQEILVDFQGGDIDRPYILGGLYNGKGEGGIPATPGGQSGASDTSVFDAATDQHGAGQGNLAGGNSPAWHGGAESSHRHAAALAGFKSKEFGGSGYNQLVMDDSDQQQRVQLKSSQHSSELNLGHLIHQADNYRGSLRGSGAELRTDAWGALRAGQGLSMSTWAHPDTRQPAGDMAPASALLKQAQTQAETLSRAAATHQTVQLAGAIGSSGQRQSRIDDQAAPLQALHTVSRGMVDARDEGQAKAEAGSKNVGAAADKTPQLTDAAIIQAGRAGMAQIAGQNLQFANGETLVLSSGEDSNFAIAGSTRLHAGQAIGLLAGAIGPGEGNTGIKLIAAKDDIDLQAQGDDMKIMAKQDVKLVSVTDKIDFAAAKKIVIAISGGARITIDGGITTQCPGTITVHAAKKSFTGPVSQNYALPEMPRESMLFDEKFQLTDTVGDPLANMRLEIIKPDGTKTPVFTDAQGMIPLQQGFNIEKLTIRVLGRINGGGAQ